MTDFNSQKLNISKKESTTRTQQMEYNILIICILYKIINSSLKRYRKISTQQERIIIFVETLC